MLTSEAKKDKPLVHQDSVMLVFPPLWDDQVPYLAVPLLTGFLRKHGIVVIHRDFNAEWKAETYSAAHMQELGQRLQEELARADLDSEQRERLANASMVIPYLSERISAALVDLQRSDLNVSEVNRAARLIAAAVSVCWTFYRRPHDLSRLSLVREAVQSGDNSPFVSWYEREIRAVLSGRRVRLVGISIGSESQLLPGFMLAQVIKRLDPKTPIVIGGALLPYMRAALLKTREAFDWVDYYVVGEGETPLLRLCQHLAGEVKLSDVPNLIYFDRQADAIGANQISIEEVNALARLDLDGLDMTRYRASGSVWLQSSRGCYWDRCSFCSLCFSVANTYRERDIGLVLDDIEYLLKTYHLTNIKFADECFSVNRLTELVEGLERRGLAGSFKYFGLMRFDHRLTRELCERAYRSGLRYVGWGLESAHPETLRLMRKGIKPEVAARCLEYSHASGIWNTVYVLAEFPGAPAEDMQETADFALRNQEYIDFVDIDVFRLEPGSEVYRHPEQYGVAIPVTPDDYICPRHSYHDLKVDRKFSNQTDFADSSLRVYWDKIFSKPTHLVSWIKCSLSPDQLMKRLDGGVKGKLALRAEIKKEADQQPLLEDQAGRIASAVLRTPKHLQVRVSEPLAGFSRRAVICDDRTGRCSVVNLATIQILHRIGDGKAFVSLVDDLTTHAVGVERRQIEAEVGRACQELVLNGYLEAEFT